MLRNFIIILVCSLGVCLSNAQQQNIQRSGTSGGGSSSTFEPTQFTTNASGQIVIKNGVVFTNDFTGPTNIAGALAAKAPLVSPSFTTPDIGAATATSLTMGGTNLIGALAGKQPLQTGLTTGTVPKAGSSLTFVDGPILIASTTNATLTGNFSANALVSTNLATIYNVNYTTATDTYAATVTLDFSAAYLQTISLTGDLILATSNLAAGRKIVVRLITDGTIRNLTFPGTWTFIGASAPVSQAASKTALLELTSFSTTDANVVAAYAVQP